MVHVILRISPHHSPHLRCHHLSLSQPFTLDLKSICFIIRFIHSFSAYICAVSDLRLGPDLLVTGVCLF